MNAITKMLKRFGPGRATPLQRYRDEGWAIYRDVLPPPLIAEARAHLDWLQARHPNTRPEALGHTLVTDDPFWVRLVSDPALLDIAEQYVGPDIALFASAYLSKPPRDGQPVLWHQDGSYWPLEPMHVVTLWLAIDDSTPENGCMRVIPRTHTSALAAIQTREDIPNALGSGMDPALVDATQAVDLVLRAGDVSIHHPNIVHGSEPNLSDRRRCGLTIRYIPASTKILIEGDAPFPSAFLLRGQATPGLNRYNPWPRYRAGVHMPFAGCERFGG